ncbi:MAG TPA: DUF6283 family protein, partial [Gemmatimonadaceae bacterium]
MDKVTQCKSCPWRIDCEPDKDIPRYNEKLHEALRVTIRSGMDSLVEAHRHIMACHYSKPGEEFPCAGWLANQLGPGNNFGLRLAVMSGKTPAPEVDGPQHQRFEDTLPRSRRDKARRSNEA